MFEQQFKDRWSRDEVIVTVSHGKSCKHDLLSDNFTGVYFMLKIDLMEYTGLRLLQFYFILQKSRNFYFLDDINMFSSDKDHEEFHQNRYKFNVHAHFTKLNDIEDLSKNNAMRPDDCVVSSEK